MPAFALLLRHASVICARPCPRTLHPWRKRMPTPACLMPCNLKRSQCWVFPPGAPSAMQLCLRHPTRCTALVLVVPLVYSGRPAAAPPSALREFLINTAVSSDFIFWSMSKLARNTMFKTVLGTPPEDVAEAGVKEHARVTEFLSHIEPISERKKGLQNESAIAQSLPRYDLERLRVPTLVSSIEDCLYKTYPGARYTAENIPGARFVGYAMGGHLAVGHEKELWSEVRQFLSACDVGLAEKSCGVD